ncbi:hypothetical protein BH23PAT2_BH23PAT2_06430 [soil metagenome]
MPWNIYEIRSVSSSLNDVMLRGRIRKLGIEKAFNVGAEITVGDVAQAFVVATSATKFSIFGDAEYFLKMQPFPATVF